MALPLSYRTIHDSDLPFLFQVYASTREQELLLTGWSEKEKNDFLSQQFEAQHKYYQQIYDQGEEFLIIVKERVEIGRLYVGRWGNNIHIIDITLLPQYRNHGIGSNILTELLGEAHTKGGQVSIHVEKTNIALRLYHRLGFVIDKDEGVYWRLIN